MKKLKVWHFALFTAFIAVTTWTVAFMVFDQPTKAELTLAQDHPEKDCYDKAVDKTVQQMKEQLYGNVASFKLAEKTSMLLDLPEETKVNCSQGEYIVNNRFFKKRINRQVEKELESEGWDVYTGYDEEIARVSW